MAVLFCGLVRDSAMTLPGLLNDLRRVACSLDSGANAVVLHGPQQSQRSVAKSVLEAWAQRDTRDHCAAGSGRSPFSSTTLVALQPNADLLLRLHALRSDRLAILRQLLQAEVGAKVGIAASNSLWSAQARELSREAERQEWGADAGTTVEAHHIVVIDLDLRTIAVPSLSFILSSPRLLHEWDVLCLPFVARPRGPLGFVDAFATVLHSGAWLYPPTMWLPHNKTCCIPENSTRCRADAQLLCPQHGLVASREDLRRLNDEFGHTRRPIQVRSCFNGLAIYARHSFFSCRYVPMEQAIAALPGVRPFVGKMPGGEYELCEHVRFHECLHASRSENSSSQPVRLGLLTPGACNVSQTDGTLPHRLIGHTWSFLSAGRPEQQKILSSTPPADPTAQIRAVDHVGKT